MKNKMEKKRKKLIIISNLFFAPPPPRYTYTRFVYNVSAAVTFIRFDRRRGNGDDRPRQKINLLRSRRVTPICCFINYGV